jgi:hypothetical protein
MSRSEIEHEDALAEIARLRAALKALVDDQEGKLPAGVADYDTHLYCIYCDDERSDFRDAGHKPDCPIVVARKLLEP